MKNRFLRLLRLLRRYFVSGLLVCGVFALWVCHAAHRKTLNIALLKAAESEHAVEVESLLQQGADPNVRLYAYEQSSSTGVLGRWFSRDIFRPWYFRSTLQETFSMYHRHGGPPVIARAASYECWPVFEALLRHGADVDVEDDPESDQHTTLLMLAAKRGDPKIIAALLLRHPHINIRDTSGATPLHHAIYGHQLAATRLLLQARANPNVWDNYGYTPLMNLATSPDGDVVDIAALLLQYHADINQRNKYHKTALTIAREQNNTRLIPFLIQHGAQP